MDADRFDTLTHSLTGAATSRRRLLTAAGSALATLAAALGVADAGATHYTCRHVGKPCTRKGQCCSGLCRGPQGKKTCRARGAGTCQQQGQALGCTASDVTMARCNNDAGCVCMRTTADSNYCAKNVCLDGDPICGRCAVCKRDADCVAQGFPAGSACIPHTDGRCAGLCESGTACLLPCGS